MSNFTGINIIAITSGILLVLLFVYIYLHAKRNQKPEIDSQ